MIRRLILITALGACGEPLLKNAPAPNPAGVAGVAAAAAAAMTLAQPDKKPEAKKADPDNRGVEVKETVPPDVFDRLDHQPAPPPGEPAKPAKPGTSATPAHPTVVLPTPAEAVDPGAPK